MEAKQFGQDWVLRLDRGDEILDSITAFCRDRDIAAGSITGIGATDHAEVGVYSLSEKVYHKHLIQGDMEIISLTGNITRKDGEPYIHLHIAMCGQNNVCVGGHLNSARISVTGEIFIHPVTGPIGRKPDPETNINMMEF